MRVKVAGRVVIAWKALEAAAAAAVAAAEAEAATTGMYVRR